MRHQKKTVKLGREASHRKALIANQAISLILHNEIRTTLAKAKAVRPFAEKLITLAKKGTVHARRLALAKLYHNQEVVSKLFSEIAPRTAGRNGGYTRIIKLGHRRSDAAPVAILQWVDQSVAAAGEADESTTNTTVTAPAEAAAPEATEAPKAEASEKSEEPKA